MKTNYWALVAIFALVAAVISIALWLMPSHAVMTGQATDTESQDVLNTENLIPRINVLRAQNGLPAVTEDLKLEQQANDLSAKVAKSNGPSSITSTTIIDSYKTLNGDYYSASGMLSDWSKDPVKSAVLLGGETNIGVWVSYIIPSQGAKPVPWIAIVTQL